MRTSGTKSVLTALWPWPDVELTDSARDTLTPLHGLRDASTKMALAALRAHPGFPEMDDSFLEAPAALCGLLHEDCILRDMAAFSLDLRQLAFDGRETSWRVLGRSWPLPGVLGDARRVKGNLAVEGWSAGSVEGGSDVVVGGRGPG